MKVSHTKTVRFSILLDPEDLVLLTKGHRLLLKEEIDNLPIEYKEDSVCFEIEVSLNGVG